MEMLNIGEFFFILITFISQHEPVLLLIQRAFLKYNYNIKCICFFQ